MKTKDLAEEMGLGKFFKGKNPSFADASKKIGDIRDEATKKDMMERLAKLQEHKKMQESLKANSQEVPDMMNGQIPKGFESPQQGQMAMGGFRNPKDPTDKDGEKELDKTDVQNINEATGIAFDQTKANSLFETTNTAERINPEVDFGKYGDAGYFTQGNTIGENRVAIHNTNKNPHNAHTVKQLMGYLKERNPNVELDMQYQQKRQNPKALGGFTEMSGAGKAAGIAGMAGSAMDLGMEAFGDTGVDASGLAGRQEKENVGMGAASGALKGASAGAALGPWGAAVGGVVGGAAGFIGGSRANKKIQEGNMNTSLIQNNKFSNDFSGGGLASSKLGKGFGNRFDIDFNPGSVSMQNNPGITNGYDFSAEGMAANNSYKPELNNGQITPKAGGSVLGKAADWMGDNYGNVLRTAPIVSNAAQLANLDKASRERLDRVDSRYKQDPVDERSLENRVQNEATNTSRALAGASNGSMGTLRSNLLGAQAQKTAALSDAYLKAGDINRRESRAAQQFNARNEMMNLRQSNRENEINARNDGAYNSAKSALQSQLANDIGSFGKERTNMKQVAEMFGYKWNGEYAVDNNGRRIDLSKLLEKNKNKENTKA